MNELLSLKQACISVLTMKFQPNQIYIGIPIEIQRKLQLDFFPIIKNPRDLQNLMSENHDFLGLLKSTPFSMNFDREIVSFFSNDKNSIISNFSQSATFILFNEIVLFYKEFNCEFVNEILEITFNLIDILKNDSDNLILAQSLFLSTIEVYFINQKQQLDNPITQKIFHLLEKFLLIPGISPKSQNILLIIANNAFPKLKILNFSYVREFFQLVDTLQKQLADKFDKQVLSNIISNLTLAISSLDIFALEIFSKYLNFLSENSITMTVDILIKSFLIKICNLNHQIIASKNSEKNDQENDDIIDISQFLSNDNQMISNVYNKHSISENLNELTNHLLEIKEKSSITENLVVEDDPNFYQICEIIANVLNDFPILKKRFFLSFIKKVQYEEDRFQVDLIYCLVILMKGEAPLDFESLRLFIEISMSLIFIPTNDQKILYLREKTLIMIFNTNYDEQEFGILFNTFEKRPDNYSQLIISLCNIVDEIHKTDIILLNILLSNHKLLNILISNDSLSDLIISSIKNVRYQIFALLHKIMEIRCDLMINDRKHLSKFVSFSFEIDARIFIFKHLKKLLKQHSDNENIQNEIIRLFEIFSNQPNEDTIQFMIDLFNLINNEIISSSFLHYISDVVHFISQLEKNEKVQQILISFLKILFQFSHQKLKPIGTDLFENIFVNNFCDSKEINTLLIEKLFNLSCGRLVENLFNNLNNFESFEIINPRAIKIILRVIYIKMEENSFTKEELVDIKILVNKINQLSDFSLNNCELFNSVGIDIDTILFIFKKRDDELFDQELMNSLLLLLSNIMISSSSLNSVRTFISLLCPNDGKYLSYYHKNIVNSLVSIVNRSNRVPSVFFPLSGKIIIHGLNYQNLVNGLNVSFWLCPSENDQFQLFSIESLLNISIVHHQVRFSLMNNESEMISLEKRIKSSNWQIFSVYLYYQNYNLSVSFYSENELLGCHDFGIAISSDFQFESVIGQNGNVNEIMSYLGSLCIIDGNSEENKAVSFLHKFGCNIYSEKIIEEDEKIILFAIPTYISKNSLSLTFISKFVKCQFNQIKIQKLPLSFNSVIAKHSRVDYFIPLFAQSGLNLHIKNENDECPNNEVLVIPDILEISMNIVGELLKTNTSAQLSFSEQHGFAIIAHLLRSAASDKITFGLYEKTLSIYELLTDPVFKKKFAVDILFAIDIWIRCDDLNKIVLNWVMTSNQLFQESFTNISILSILRIYFWYSPIEESIIYQDRSPKINIKECRLVFLSVIEKSNKLNSVDIASLISHALSCPDIEQSLELLDCLSNLVENRNNSNIFESILSLHYLLYIKNYQLVEKALNIIIDAHTKGLIHSITFPEHVEVICFDLPLLYSNDDLFKNLFAKLEKNVTPELFNFCFYLALITKEDNLIKLLDFIETRPTFNFYNIKNSSTLKTWCLWPIVALFLYNLLTKRILDLIVSSNQENWQNLYNMTEVVGDILEVNAHEIKHIILMTIATQIVSIGNNDCFLKMASHFLFVRENKSFLKYNDIAKIEKWDIFRGKILFSEPQINSLSNRFYFGTVMKEDDLWCDGDLAQVVVSLYEKDPVENYIEFIILMGAYLLISEKDPLHNVKKKVKISSCPALLIFNHMAAHFRENKINYKNKKNKMDKDTYIANFIENHKSYFDDFYTFSEVYQKELMTIIKEFKDDNLGKFNNLSNQMIKSYADDDKYTKSSTKKLWSTFWRSMTVEKAPWYYSIPHVLNGKTVGGNFYKRDFTYTYLLCPTKMSINYHYDDHLKESLIRDSRNLESAEAKYQELIENQKQQMEEAKPHEVFAVLGEKNANTLKVNTASKSTLGRIKFEVDNCEIRKPGKNKEKVKFMITNNMILIDTISIKPNEIHFVFLRNVRQRPTAIEIFDIYGNSYFINFPFGGSTSIYAMDVLNHMKSLTKNVQLQPFKPFFESKNFTQQWVNGEISNFEYLMTLNIYAGRSFNDVFNYPVMPWVISDYQSNELKLDNPEFFRDLTKSIGAISPKRIETLRKTYSQYTAQSIIKPFLYSSWHICPLTLYLYLIRIEPFTTLHTKIQSGKFDHPGRLFSSIQSSYEFCTTQVNDFRELIPEFYCSPEFLVNANNFDFGVFNNEKINHVKLPNWAKTPLDFVYKHRKALESEHVSKLLHCWIDFIFGSKQRSIEFDNVFNEMMYADIWETEFGKNPSHKIDIETTLDYVGQVPPLLFDKPHPQKKVLNSNSTQNKVKLPTKKMMKETVLDMEIKAGIYSENKMVYLIDSTDNSLVIMQIKKSGKTKLVEKTKKCFSKIINSSNIINAFLAYSLVSKNEIIVIRSSTNGDDIFCRTKHEIVTFSLSNNYFVTSDVDSNLSFYRYNDNQNQNQSAIMSLTQSSSVDILNRNNTNIISINDSLNNVNLPGNATLEFNLPTFRECLSKITISDTFHMAICGTNDGCLLFVSTNKRSIEKTVDIGDRIEPVEILITNSWGFVAVCGEQSKTVNCENTNGAYQNNNKNYYFLLYSINGEEILRRKIAHRIRFWTCWTSNDGFDYILMCDESNVYAFEAYYGNITIPFIAFTEEIVGMTLIEQKNKVAIFLKYGKIVITPIEIVG
ncbi:hypothetical protein TRFO_18717 [Tritrichomonas foetus]|uniref:BEACH domain-containing protein n=1 Tax=Tritrichomonas foetus TaxID=1144522 RepID=A0A1J4KPM2_9EUKA|nr:hypothetical protein TRFO_18717 [Tritrichomonas foetus]|eukprot:OHT11740.1 hypothetical protein TRFO_18717 [Tritrichomonas foetus]